MIPTPSESRTNNRQLRGFSSTCDRLKLTKGETLQYAQVLLEAYRSDIAAMAKIPRPTGQPDGSAALSQEAGLLSACLEGGDYSSLATVQPRG